MQHLLYSLLVYLTQIHLSAVLSSTVLSCFIGLNRLGRCG